MTRPLTRALLQTYTNAVAVYIYVDVYTAVRLADHSLGMANLKHTKGGQTFAVVSNQLIMQKVKYIKSKIVNDVRKLADYLGALQKYRKS